MRKGSLSVVGTGIRLVRQVTLEAQETIVRADKLVYMVADPVVEAWIQTLNRNSESLSGCYAKGKLRRDSYAEMVRRILAPVRSGLNVCAAFYGHPGVFVNPSHEAMRIARQEGYKAVMLPGISAEDCLFADLGLDPGERGCQSFEATDFLIRHRKFDPTSSLILWQIGFIGELGIRATPRRLGLRILTEVLSDYYPKSHEVVLYEAAVYPVCEPVIQRLPLIRLGKAPASTLTTLYVPPKASPEPDPKMLKHLKMDWS